MNASDINIDKLNQLFENSDAGTVLHWTIKEYKQDLAMSTGFGVSGIVLMHHISLIDPRTNIFYLDTGLLFDETYKLIDQLEEQLGIHLTRVRTDVPLDEQARLYGEKLWETDPDTCCHIRKVLPLQRYLKDKKAWVTGIRRDQSASRRNTPVFQWNESNQVVKINPLAGWTEEEVWSYVKRHSLPYNELHERGYTSIGCFPCTRPAKQGGDLRSGRWAGTMKTECGLHRN